MLALGCFAVAALSLLVFDEPTYDPTAWLIWGRQIAHGTLDTVAGPVLEAVARDPHHAVPSFGDDGAIGCG